MILSILNFIKPLLQSITIDFEPNWRVLGMNTPKLSSSKTSSEPHQINSGGHEGNNDLLTIARMGR